MKLLATSCNVFTLSNFCASDRFGLFFICSIPILSASSIALLAISLFSNKSLTFSSIGTVVLSDLPLLRATPANIRDIWEIAFTSFASPGSFMALTIAFTICSFSKSLTFALTSSSYTSCQKSSTLTFFPNALCRFSFIFKTLEYPYCKNPNTKSFDMPNNSSCAFKSAFGS